MFNIEETDVARISIDSFKLKEFLRAFLVVLMTRRAKKVTLCQLCPSFSSINRAMKKEHMHYM